MNRTTTFSPCRQYRYTLWREWGLFKSTKLDYVMFIGLNPSTADETLNDPTIRRCIGYAKSWGYRSLCMTNLFAFRATDPKVMKQQDDPVGPDNNKHLLKCAKGAGVIVAAWGLHGAFMDRGQQVRALLPQLHCLRLTKGKHPEHPTLPFRQARSSALRSG